MKKFTRSPGVPSLSPTRTGTEFSCASVIFTIGACTRATLAAPATRSTLTVNAPSAPSVAAWLIPKNSRPFTATRRSPCGPIRNGRFVSPSPTRPTSAPRWPSITGNALIMSIHARATPAGDTSRPL